MTFGLGMKTHDGLVALADTRLTRGNQMDAAKKVTLHRTGGRDVFVMTSGLRSIRDKTLTYLDVDLDSGDQDLQRLYEFANLFSAKLRLVADEDEERLKRAGLHIDLHALIGGQLAQDREHRLYMVYPEGNWVEVSRTTPYYIIGATGYGKPILDRVLRYENTVYQALKVGLLAFDATRTSSNDVGFPLDVVTFLADGCRVHQHRFSQDEVAPLSNWWSAELSHLVEGAPSDVVDLLCAKAFGPEGHPPPTG